MSAWGFLGILSQAWAVAHPEGRGTASAKTVSVAASNAI